MTTTDQTAPGRRRASQARSKATVQRILDAATALIIEKGGEAVTMTEIAQRADVVIGSLYQYFSDRSAIHSAILVKHQADVRGLLSVYLSDVTDIDQFIERLAFAAERYFDLHQSDPLFDSLWSIVQTDAALQVLDIEDSLENARTLSAIARPLLPGVDSDRLMATCALLLQLSVSTARFARAIPAPLARETLPAFQGMLRDAFEALKREGGG